MSLADAWEKFYNYFSSKQVIGRTDLGYWKNHIEPYFKNCLLAEITVKLLLQFTTVLESKQLSPQTIHHCLALIKRIFNKMRLLGEYSGEVPIFIMPRYDNKRIRFLTKEEANLLLCNLKMVSLLWFDISTFALNTGLRASEIFRLRCSNINLESSLAYIFDPKNTLNRVIPLNRKALQSIEKYLSQPEQFIFVGANNQIRQASKIFREAVTRAGLNNGIIDRRQKIVFHSLRHTFASWLVQNGVSLDVIGKLLGHKTIQVTQRYAHIAANQEQSAVKLLESL